MNSAAEGFLADHVADLKKSLVKLGRSEEEALAEIIRRRGVGEFSLAKSQSNGLVEKLLNDWRVRHFVTAADKKALMHGMTKNKWWYDRWGIALPFKCCTAGPTGKDDV